MKNQIVCTKFWFCLISVLSLKNLLFVKGSICEMEYNIRPVSR